MDSISRPPPRPTGSSFTLLQHLYISPGCLLATLELALGLRAPRYSTSCLCFAAMRTPTTSSIPTTRLPMLSTPSFVSAPCAQPHRQSQSPYARSRGRRGGSRQGRRALGSSGGGQRSGGRTRQTRTPLHPNPTSMAGGGMSMSTCPSPRTSKTVAESPL